METNYPKGKQYVETVMIKGMFGHSSSHDQSLYDFVSQPYAFVPEMKDMEPLYKAVEEALQTNKKLLLAPVADFPHGEDEILFVVGVYCDCLDYDLATLYERRGLYEEALKHYERAVRTEKDPTGVAYRDAGWLCMKMSCYYRAYQFFTGFGAISADDNEYVAGLYKTVGYYEEALKVYRKFFPKFVNHLVDDLEEFGPLENDLDAYLWRRDDILECYNKLGRGSSEWFRICCDYYMLCRKEAERTPLRHPKRVRNDRGGCGK